MPGEFSSRLQPQGEFFFFGVKGWKNFCSPTSFPVCKPGSFGERVGVKPACWRVEEFDWQWRLPKGPRWCRAEMLRMLGHARVSSHSTWMLPSLPTIVTHPIGNPIVTHASVPLMTPSDENHAGNVPSKMQNYLTNIYYFHKYPVQICRKPEPPLVWSFGGGEKITGGDPGLSPGKSDK